MTSSHNIHLKSPEEIELIRQSSILVSDTLAHVAAHVKPGVKTVYLDKIAEEFIRDNGAIPGFLNYGGFPATLCISPNDQVVHGIPNSYELKDGDIVSIDCGVLKNSYYGDSAYTFSVGEVGDSVKKLMNVTKDCLSRAISQVRVGNRIGDIGAAVQLHAESNGFAVVRDLVGHGLGRRLHEKPEVPNYGRQGTGIKLQEGMVIAIEPMINAGNNHKVRFWDDGWTVTTVDGSLSAHYEHTVAVTKNGVEVLSSFEEIEKVLQKKNIF